jgi:DNA-binding PadR family transcriptional regulator
MEQKGYVIYRESVEDGKFKKLYSISDLGKDYFLCWLEQPIEFEKANHNYLVNIYFYNYLPINVAQKNLKKFVSILEQNINQLNKQKIFAEENYSLKHNFVYSTLNCGIHYFQAIITWCNDLIVQLEE